MRRRDRARPIGRRRATARARPATSAKGGEQAGRARASCSCATGSTCCSTRARSSRTRCWPTRRAGDLPADGVVTGVGRGRRPAGVRDGQRPDGEGRLVGRPHRREDRPPHRVRAAPRAARSFWLVDSAGARITDQVELFPGRRGAGRIFYNQVRLSGRVPQICCLFGPSAAGGAYIPAFCDIVIMVEGNASMYLGLAPHGRDGDRRDDHARGDGRRPHARHRVGLRRQPGRATTPTPSTRREALPHVLPDARGGRAAAATSRPSRPRALTAVDDPRRRSAPGYDMHDVIDALVDAETLLRDQAAVRAGADRRPRPARRAARSASWPTTRCTRAACCSSTRPTRRPASSGAATRSTSRWCSWPTCPGS